MTYVPNSKAEHLEPRSRFLLHDHSGELDRRDLVRGKVGQVRTGLDAALSADILF